MFRDPGKQSCESVDAQGWLPVTLVSGFFGAGKSALIRHLLGHRGSQRWALLVSDRSERLEEICARDTKGVQPFYFGEALVELMGRCVGCSFRQNFTEAVLAIAQLWKFDRLIVECSGLTEPEFVVELFNDAMAEGGALASVACLDQMVTVVDGETLWENLHSSDQLRDRGLSSGADDNRSISGLLVDQIEYSSLLVLNKLDRVPLTRQIRLTRLLEHLNPEATVLRGTYGAVPVESVLAERPCRQEPVSFQPGWLKMVEGMSISPAVCDAQWTTGLFQATRPFHPGRFWEMIKEDWPGVLRVRGYFWLASQPDRCLVWAQTAGVCHLEWVGNWWAATPEIEWPGDEEFRRTLAKDWTVEFGDRRQVLAFIGYRVDLEECFHRLRTCLVTPSEALMGDAEWTNFDEPVVLTGQEGWLSDEDEERD